MNSHRSRQPIWIPVVAPIVWSTHFMACYVLAALWCGRFTATRPVRAGAWIVILTAIAVVIIGLCFAHGWRHHDRRLPDEPNDDDSPDDRRRFLAFTTMLLAGLSLLATLIVGGAALAVERCQ